ncbi:MFS transporter [Hazenella coriacea]|uniref:ACDE family multidrug resistance protein n=1 Tax=Hazenella coriacea TaxID=1179467 RepID=A0A4R3LAV3_9BACL|nr:MFS transporter [Hazenella coriacea]TCS96398.1 ACDE family multidrug resistance protein [Hazenella coriacea]
MTTANLNKKQKTTPNAAVLIVLSSIPLIMVLGNSMLIPVLPTIGKELGITTFQVSLLITLFSIPAAIVIPIAGILADRLGRKRVIVVSLIIYGIGGLLGGIASIWQGGSYLFLLIARIIQGIGAAGTAPIAMVLAGDLFKKGERSKALGIIESSNAMGKVLSPIFGSLLAAITWYAMFFVFPIFTIPVAIALWKLIDEPALEQKPLPLVQYKERIFKTFKRQGRWISITFLAGLLIFFTTFGVLFYLSDLLEKRYGLDGLIKGFVIAIPVLFLAVTAYWTGSYIKNHARMMKRLIMIGLITITASVAAMPWFSGAVMTIILSSLIGTGTGLIVPCLNTLITSAVGIQERGVITSLYGSVRFFGVALGPPVFGALTNRPIVLFLSVAAAMGIVTVLAGLMIHRPQHLRGKDGHSRVLLRKRRFHPAT